MSSKLSVTLLAMLAGVTLPAYQSRGYERCSCYNPLAGTIQEFAGEIEFTCAFNQWCFVPCDSRCGDMETMTGFFGGKCKSVSACDPKQTPTTPAPTTPTPTAPPSATVGPTAAPPPTQSLPCECLDPNAISCSTHSKCFASCDSDCTDKKKTKRGKCVTAEACPN
eukprot:GFUD01039490.1.p1 GENE.GFUD01039490.1~~GFUD01039490.1.p1  ORF type:complete len:173 (-),score=37.03 GFUD01039490.1:138-635(-)